VARKKKHHEEHMDESWLIPYADILTLLLALFIVLFAMSQVDQNKFQEIKQALESIFKGGVGIMTTDKGIDAVEQYPDVAFETPTDYIAEEITLKQKKEVLDEYFKKQGLENVVTSVITEYGLQISIQDVALFESGKATLRTDSLKVLDHLASVLSGLNNEIRIAGHTDNLPINTPEFPSNWELSTQRSLTVMKYLLKTGHLQPHRFSTIGHGEYRPIASNDTNEGRAKNRRVEILILRSYNNLNAIRQ
jgi:chemotaxis protein MotB